MTKADLIKAVAQNFNVTQREVEQVLNGIMDVVVDALKRGDKVILPKLGKFIVVQKKERVARNPKTGEKIKVPATKAVKFSQSKELKEALN